MITIIAGTNRKGSNTKKVAKEYHRLLREQNIEAQIFSLDEHLVTERNEIFIEAEAQYLLPPQKFIFILPEYNGSYPGILKLMIDNTNVSEVWWHKKVLLTGVSSGRAGNLRGMEHITGSMLHMKMLVHPNRLPLSVIGSLLDEHDQLKDAAAIDSVKIQLQEFISF